MNDKIISFGVEPVECSYCNTPGMDNIHHIFVSRNFANNIWHYVSSLFGMSHSHAPLSSLLLYWWQQRPKNEVCKLLCQSLPPIICLNPWKNRCLAKYRGKRSNISRVKILIYRDISHLLITTFPYVEWPSN